MPAPSAAPAVVIDTNVVLDWLLFDHPDARGLSAALADGELRWIATATMRDELSHVLAGEALGHWHPDRQSRASLWARWDRHCAEVPAPVPAGHASRFRCTDPDDQKFIDLAVAGGASLLLSRDRAVLKLARRLGPLGVRVVTPAAWAAGRATG